MSSNKAPLINFAKKALEEYKAELANESFSNKLSNTGDDGDTNSSNDDTVDKQ